MLENRGIDFHPVKKCNMPISTVSTFNKYVSCLRHTVYQDPHFNHEQNCSTQELSTLHCLLYKTRKKFIVCKNSQIPFMEYYLISFPDDNPLKECSVE